MAADPLGGTVVDASTVEVLSRRRGAGHPLPDSVADPMGEELGVDTSTLRVHADPQAGTIARSMQADAFTFGNDIYFAPGRYQPTSGAGQRVIAHELSHVAAQRARADNEPPGPLSVGRADDPAEAAADRSADRVVTALRRSRNPGNASATIALDASAPQPTAPGRGAIVRRMSRSDVKDKIHVSFSAMTVVNGWWIAPGTTGDVVDSSGDGDVAIKLTAGDYAGEVVKVGARYFDEVDRPKEPVEQPVKVDEGEKVVLGLAGQLEEAFGRGVKPQIEQLQKIIQTATAKERKQVADDEAFLSRAKAALDEDTYLGLLPALGVYKEPTGGELSEGGPGHTTAGDADVAIRETLQEYLAAAVKAGRKVEGEVSVVGDEDFQMAFDRQWVRAAGQSFGEDKAWEVCNAFVDVNLPKRHIWVHRDMGNTGTVIHEGMHKYADDILRDEQIALANKLGIAHGGVSRLDEGITEYFTRIVTDQLEMDERENYGNEFEVAFDLAEKIGERALAKAYYDGQLGALRKPFGAEWERFAEAIERSDWDWLFELSNWK